MKRRFLLFALAAEMLLVSGGCGVFHRKPKVQAPPAPPVAVESPKPEPKPPAAPRKPRSVPPAQTPAPPAPAAPRLGEVLSVNQQEKLRLQLDANVAAARRILASLSKRSLTRQQSETASRVHAFLAQAEDLKVRDLSTAVELSRRALLLAQDLAGSAQ